MIACITIVALLPLLVAIDSSDEDDHTAGDRPPPVTATSCS